MHQKCDWSHPCAVGVVPDDRATLEILASLGQPRILIRVRITQEAVSAPLAYVEVLDRPEHHIDLTNIVAPHEHVVVERAPVKVLGPAFTPEMFIVVGVAKEIRRLAAFTTLDVGPIVPQHRIRGPGAPRRHDRRFHLRAAFEILSTARPP